VNAKNSDGNSVLSLAHAHADVIALLKAAGGE